MILATSSPLGLALATGAAVAYLAATAVSPRWHRASIWTALLVGWSLHAATLVVGLLGTPALFGFGPALSMTAWLVLTVYGIESLAYPALRMRRVLAALAALAVLVARLFPGTPLHVAASPWLPMHLALGLASYGLFGAAVLHAWLMARAENQMRTGALQLASGSGSRVGDEPPSGVPLLTLERLTFRFVLAGFALLSATLLAGVFFSESLYGTARIWRADHKTVFSILAWITFGVLLLGRVRFGWRGRGARRMLYTGAGLLLLAYVGSRFVLEVLLGRTL
ncbi:MAG: cytochrome c biogenesis protein CcsA [Variovorax sp.]